MGLKAEWANLPQRKCDACPLKYKPKRPDQRFCSNKCRMDFHHHGGAYVKLTPMLEKFAERRVREATKELRERISRLEAALAGRAA